MLVLGRRVLAEHLIKTIELHPNIKAFGVYNYNHAAMEAAVRSPDIALVEIPEREGFPALDTLQVCGEIRKASPGCKIVILCPEHDKESVRTCVESKREGRIEDFLFYETSADFLAAKVASLCPAEGGTV
jgi:DNA-binding NarL/FixJ family response regulator